MHASHVKGGNFRFSLTLLSSLHPKWIDFLLGVRVRAHAPLIPFKRSEMCDEGVSLPERKKPDLPSSLESIQYSPRLYVYFIAMFHLYLAFTQKGFTVIFIYLGHGARGQHAVVHMASSVLMPRKNQLLTA